MKGLYEPEYIKILRKSQFRGKDQLAILDRGRLSGYRGITDIAFNKIDKAFILVNDFIDKIYNKLEMVVIDHTTKDQANFDEVREAQMHPNNPVPCEPGTEKETCHSSPSIDFEDLNILQEKLASLLLFKASYSSRYHHPTCKKNTYGLTQYETIQFKQSMISLINQMNRSPHF
ncbi:hypothetical protein OJ252_2420 [Cryptosporidium canis]|uniref:Uncharacterized protein n=1 Tax=Cryptosporidium canis TaxID=195482 RepID=A0ABQ8P575_9CRYT|nr:hypothetical protein OJ252_2420 [Cryptosporidium canis]